MHEIDENIARDLEAGGPLAANVSAGQARACLSTLNEGSDAAHIKFKDLLEMKNDPGDFFPFKKFWGIHSDFLSIPPGEDWTPERKRIPAQLRAYEPCFTLFAEGSSSTHHMGVEVFIGYEEDKSCKNGWRRVVSIRE